MKTVKKIVYISSIILTILGILLVTAGYLYVSNLELNTEGKYETVDGIITDVYEQGNSLTVYEFYTQGGEKIQGTTKLISDLYPVDQKIKVRYLSENPNENVIDSFLFYGFVSILLYTFGGMCIIFGIAILIIAFNVFKLIEKRKNEKELAEMKG